MAKWSFFLLLLFSPCAFAAPKAAPQKPLIVIDPGHGDFDEGAQVKGLKEKELALEMALLIKKHLHVKGYRVVLTRTKDVFLPLDRRAAIANRTKSKLFVSIHFNAYKEAAPHGIEIYYYHGGKGWREKASKKLAHTLLNGMIAATKAKNRGVKSGNFHVIRETQMPAVLVEGGFITNPEERRKLADSHYVDLMARSIAGGIERYLAT